ncbi:MAG TPA: hypothetical protein VKB38_05430 [Terracidiphilus sp.]|nr:hypothetical protein [Terracidiphilus sp.]
MPPQNSNQDAPHDHAAPDPNNELVEGINRTTLLYFAFVLAAGAVGGLLYWITAKWTGTQLPVVFGAATVLVLMLLGALAAAVGVYVLTASDMSAIRTYVFAVLCGLAWQPVLAAGTRMASNAAASSQTAQLGQQVQQIQTATQSGNTTQVTAAVQQTVPVITKSLELSSTVADQDKKNQILDTSKQAVNQLEQSAAQAPEASVDALQNVSVTAANSSAPSVAIQGIQSLNRIRQNALLRHDLALSDRIQRTLGNIAAQSKDATVQTAAKQAATQPQ